MKVGPFLESHAYNTKPTSLIISFTLYGYKLLKQNTMRKMVGIRGWETNWIEPEREVPTLALGAIISHFQSPLLRQSFLHDLWLLCKFRFRSRKDLLIVYFPFCPAFIVEKRLPLATLGRDPSWNLLPDARKAFFKAGTSYSKLLSASMATWEILSPFIDIIGWRPRSWTIGVGSCAERDRHAPSGALLSFLL